MTKKLNSEEVEVLRKGLEAFVKRNLGAHDEIARRERVIAAELFDRLRISTEVII